MVGDVIPFSPAGGWDEGAVAFFSEGRGVTYADLAVRAEQVASHLYAAGARAGVPVATLLAPGQAFVEVLHATMRIGAVLMPLDGRLAAAELSARIDAARSTLLLHDDRHADLAGRLDRDHVNVRELPVGRPAPRAPVGSFDAIHSIFHTSGSTARPKMVPLSVGNLYWGALASAAVIGVRRDDRWLATLTTAHVGGLSIYLRSAIYGTSVVIHDGFDAERANRAIDNDSVTIVSLVAATLERLLEARGRRPFPPTLRCVLVGGGPIPATLLDTCGARGVPVAPTYGLTEAASQVATAAPGSRSMRVLPGTEVRRGADGELLVRGPTVSASCLGADGWLHTGDAGRVDDEGTVHVDGRIDDLIITGGENVQPAEVEAALASHPSVGEAVVAGTSDGAMGSAVVAWVRLRPGPAVSAADLRAHVRARLASFKVPRRVHLVHELPTTPLGKIDRRALREPGP